MQHRMAHMNEDGIDRSLVALVSDFPRMDGRSSVGFRLNDWRDRPAIYPVPILKSNAQALYHSEELLRYCGCNSPLHLTPTTSNLGKCQSMGTATVATLGEDNL